MGSRTRTTAGAVTVRRQAAATRSALSVRLPTEKVMDMAVSMRMAMKTTPRRGGEAARL